MMSFHDELALVRTDSASNYFSHAFFEEAAWVLHGDHVTLVDVPTLPNAGKTPTTEAELATAV